jgi:thiamine-monophosphate kinase
MERPEPRVALGTALRGIASSAIDVSDGLVADAGHLAERSKARLVIEWPSIPLSPVAQRYREQPLVQRCALTGGDDYELCFTAAASRHGQIVDLAVRLGLALTRVGRVEPGTGVAVLDEAGQPVAHAERGFDHFV